MSNGTRTAIFAAIIAAAAPGAYAQTSTVPAARAAVTSHIIQSDEVRASKMIGSTVYDLQNRNIGKVSDLVLNKDGAVDVVVLDVGSFLGMGGKYVGIPISDIKTDNNRLTLDRTKEGNSLRSRANFRSRSRSAVGGYAFSVRQNPLRYIKNLELFSI